MQTVETRECEVWAVRVNDTQYYNIRSEDRPHILGVWTVYAYDRASCTRLCELTPSYCLHYLYTYLELAHDMSDDLRGELDGRYCYETPEDTYMHVRQVERIPAAYKVSCGSFSDMDQAREHLQGNWPI